MMVSICYNNTIWTDLPRNLLHSENDKEHIRRLIFDITTSRALDLKTLRIDIIIKLYDH